MNMERRTIRRIRDAVSARRLSNVFTPADVNRVLGITWAGVFLPEHRVGNPAKPRPNTELFVQVDRGVYQLK
jgi:hypothetical protein